MDFSDLIVYHGTVYFTIMKRRRAIDSKVTAEVAVWQIKKANARGIHLLVTFFNTF